MVILETNAGKVNYYGLDTFRRNSDYVGKRMLRLG